MIICLLNQFMHVPPNTPFVTLVPTFGILYPLMSRKSSHFLVFFFQNIKNSVIDGYKSVIIPEDIMIILSVITIFLINEVILFI